MNGLESLEREVAGIASRQKDTDELLREMREMLRENTRVVNELLRLARPEKRRSLAVRVFRFGFAP